MVRGVVTCFPAAGRAETISAGCQSKVGDISAVWLRFCSEWRGRWRSWLGLALLIGLAGGAAVAAAAGARRTETAYPRFVQAQNGYDLITGGFPDKINPERALTQMAAMPEVVEWARVDVAAYAAILPSGRRVSIPELAAASDLSGRAGYQLNRFKAVSGRLADLRAPDEAMVDFPIADRQDLRVGSKLRIIVGNPDAEHPRLATVRIVGIVASPGQFPAVGASSNFSSVYVTPAFVRSSGITPSPVDASLLIRLRRGAADRDAFLRHMAAAGLGDVDIPFVQEVQTAGVQRSIRFESQALWALCALIAMAALAILGQSLARQIHLDSAQEFPVLWALGMSRVQLAALGILRAVIIGVVAALVVIPIAVLLSPLTPIGLARIAEPDPGFAVDAFPLVLGATSVLLLTVLVGAIPAWTAARTATTGAGGSEADRQRPSALASLVGRVWRSPAAVIGVRMALEPGRGRTAVPVRSTIFGATLSIAALTASLVFATSLGHLLDTPRLSGFTWDAFVAVEEQPEGAAAAFRADPKLAGFSRGGFTNVRIGRVELMALVHDGSGPARPVITDGAAPAADDEIALGASTMRATHAAIGRTVDVVLDQAEGSPKPVRMRVVGTVIVPPNPFLVTRQGEGAAMALPGLVRIDPSAAEQWGSYPFLVRFAPGVSRDAGLAAVTNDVQGLPRPFIVAAERPGIVSSLARIANVPVLLSGLLALLAMGTLAHTLVSSIQRRRRDLAILKTLGLVRPQLRSTVAWQATTLVAIALLIGLPVGIAGGRWGWRVFAGQLGVLPAPVVPLVVIFIAVPTALAIANLVAALPGRAAACTQPAIVLRSE
jgi:predicted lysophospholipase L1 biosynthesis ABC-type transport system permease subunit